MLALALPSPLPASLETDPAPAPGQSSATGKSIARPVTGAAAEDSPFPLLLGELVEEPAPAGQKPLKDSAPEFPALFGQAMPQLQHPPVEPSGKPSAPAGLAAPLPAWSPADGSPPDALSAGVAASSGGLAAGGVGPDLRAPANPDADRALWAPALTAARPAESPAPSRAWSLATEGDLMPPTTSAPPAAPEGPAACDLPAASATLQSAAASVLPAASTILQSPAVSALPAAISATRQSPVVSALPSASADSALPPAAIASAPPASGPPAFALPASAPPAAAPAAQPEGDLTLPEGASHNPLLTGQPGIVLFEGPAAAPASPALSLESIPTTASQDERRVAPAGPASPANPGESWPPGGYRSRSTARPDPLAAALDPAPGSPAAAAHFFAAGLASAAGIGEAGTAAGAALAQSTDEPKAGPEPPGGRHSPWRAAASARPPVFQVDAPPPPLKPSPGFAPPPAETRPWHAAAAAVPAQTDAPAVWQARLVPLAPPARPARPSSAAAAQPAATRPATREGSPASLSGQADSPPESAPPAPLEDAAGEHVPAAAGKREPEAGGPAENASARVAASAPPGSAAPNLTPSPDGRSAAEFQPASGARQEPRPERAATPAPTPAPPPANPTAAARDIRLELAAGERRVEVRLVDRGGDLHLAVRTPDQRLAGALRESLPELSARLEPAGFRAEPLHAPSSAKEEWRGDTGPPAARPEFDSQSNPDGRRGQGEADPRQPQDFEQQPHPKEKGQAFQWFMASFR